MAVSITFPPYLIVFTLFITFTSCYTRQPPCERTSCYPATGNLLVGRENRLTASSTCGLDRSDRYCIYSHEVGKKCFRCDSRPQNIQDPSLSHRIDSIVHKTKPGTPQRSWWQSENGVENVTIQLDLEAEFHFSYMTITFKAPSPAAMIIESSHDFGRTWQVYRYLAHDCDSAFPDVPIERQQPLTGDVVCDLIPVARSNGDEITVRVRASNHLYNNASATIYPKNTRNEITNLRINFTKFHTLASGWLRNTQDIQDKYFYAIYEMIVRGSCSCYGHASRCLPREGDESKTDMVHSRCECNHNTQGLNCEKCEDLYNDLPWRPADQDTNACKRCDCNNHATSCHFDQTVYELTGRISGGVCDNCRHNTRGRNCELCKRFFYQALARDFSDPDVCQPCNCDMTGSMSSTCHYLGGQCRCKTNVVGRRCDRCVPGTYHFGPQGCSACDCDWEGALDYVCDVNSGQCRCTAHAYGRTCDRRSEGVVY